MLSAVTGSCMSELGGMIQYLGYTVLYDEGKMLWDWKHLYAVEEARDDNVRYVSECAVANDVG